MSTLIPFYGFDCSVLLISVALSFHAPQDATNGVTGFIARELARKADGHIPLQEFVVRSDCPCGTTIGPIISSNTGIRTVDLGMPQLSMHSCREVMGIADLTNGLNLFKSFFKNFNEIDESIEG